MSSPSFSSLSASTVVRTWWAALRGLLVLTLVTGLIYPLAVTALAQVAFRGQADGSLVRRQGQVIGSALIGQSFTAADGSALPQWFQSRPSAAGKGYDALSSGGTNLGPESPDLLASITARRAAAALADGVDPAQVPADALTASFSGLDPHISPAYALEQVARVAAARSLPVARVRTLVLSQVQGRTLGFLGEPRVDVLRLNLALDALKP